MLRTLRLTASLALVACGSDETAPPLAACPDPFALELPDASCIRPGITPDACAPGFTHDGAYGCEPILPADPCPPGLMAVPGDTECHPVMPCARGRWGDIPIDATTEHVDQAYTGGGSDGTAEKPWTTIAAAVSAAAPGALVAIARGTYPEDLVVGGKPVRLAGVCPDEVAIVATGGSAGFCPAAALCIHSGAHGTEVRGVALSGAGIGLLLSGAEQVLADRIRVHETADEGIALVPTLGATSLTLRSSLVEQNAYVGLFVAASGITVEASVVRATLPRASDQMGGRGISLEPDCVATAMGTSCEGRSTGLVTGSLIEQNRENGLLAVGSDATVESSVVRTTSPRASDQLFGRGINIQLTCSGTPSGPACDPATRSTLTLRSSLVEQNHDAGIFVSGSDATVESSVVRATLPASDQTFGRGITIEPSCVTTPTGLTCDPAGRASATVRSSLVEANHESGLFVSGSDATVESSVVRATLPAADQTFGRGISIQLSCLTTPTGLACDPSARSIAAVRSSLLEQSHDVGLSVAGSDVSVEASVVRATSPRVSDGLFGDGVAVYSVFAPAVATFSRSRIEDSARAGLSNFGATVSLEATHVRCAAFALAGQTQEGQPFLFEDRGGNLCGCPTAEAACTAVSPDLEPPDLAAVGD